MFFSPKDVIKFVEENDVKFIRLTFSDILGNLKNISIMPNGLAKAFENGVSFDGVVLDGKHADLLLFPDASTLSVLPWRPKTGRVVRFFCYIKKPDGSDYKGDAREGLYLELKKIRELGYNCRISTECEFYLFDTDENGEPTKKPHDYAGYLDVAPLDKCENVRREICLMFDEMGFKPQSSRHKYGCGQNEIDFRSSEVLTAADNMVHFKSVVKTVAAQNGLYASFMPKPLNDNYGSGMHISMLIEKDGKSIFSYDNGDMNDEGRWFLAGVLNRLKEITCFLNSTTNSYKRFGMGLAPKYINYSHDERSSCIRIPYASCDNARIEIRSADSACNPYIVFKLLLKAGFEGIEQKMNLNNSLLGQSYDKFEKLPESLEEAYRLAKESEFVRSSIHEDLLKIIFNYYEDVLEKYNLAEDKDAFEEEIYFRYV
jgi:glutamine synthetase